jgi:hypothetical protein
VLWGEDIDAELEQRSVREPAMLREMTLTLFSQWREIVHAEKINYKLVCKVTNRVF